MTPVRARDLIVAATSSSPSSVPSSKPYGNSIEIRQDDTSNSTSTTGDNTLFQSAGDPPTVVFIIGMSLIGLFVIGFLLNWFCCGGSERSRIKEEQRSLRRLEEERENIANGVAVDIGLNRYYNEISQPESRRDGLFGSRSVRKPITESLVASRMRSYTHPYAQSPTVPAPAVPRTPSLSEDGESLQLPPPVYEMSSMDPLHEEVPAPLYFRRMEPRQET